MRMLALVSAIVLLTLAQISRRQPLRPVSQRRAVEHRARRHAPSVQAHAAYPVGLHQRACRDAGGRAERTAETGRVVHTRTAGAPHHRTDPFGQAQRHELPFVIPTGQ